MTRVADILAGPAISVEPSLCVDDAERISQLRRVRHLVVARGDDLLGVLCLCDLRGVAAAAPVATCMSRPVFTVAGSASLEEAAATMAALEVGCLPVLIGGRLAGVITRSDLVRAGMDFEEQLGGHFCAACGAHHDVHRDRRASEVWFCDDCEECAETRPDELAGDVIGAGD